MLTFPLKFVPKLSYKERPRSFGSSRPSGRLHAGCDLVVPAGTAVLAMDSGVVAQAPYLFYEGVWALEIIHPHFIVRYGELKAGSFPRKLVKAGALVAAGELIGHVGYMVRLHASMLHLEMYSNVKDHPAKLPLTNRGRKASKYKRRADLMDPTPYLEAAAANLTSGACGGGLWPPVGLVPVLA
jgi:murein DD-endopeptidase MepM/ murein hydrolase activator NlpD